MEIPLWWDPTVIGHYEINYPQLCGLGHYRMRGAVTVQSQADFQSFLAEEGARLSGNCRSGGRRPARTPSPPAFGCAGTRRSTAACGGAGLGSLIRCVTTRPNRQRAVPGR